MEIFYFVFRKPTQFANHKNIGIWANKDSNKIITRNIEIKEDCCWLIKFWNKTEVEEKKWKSGKYPNCDLFVTEFGSRPKKECET